ncbi:MAG: ABC transporter permease [Clostridiales bacterium]|nr:ABC transporter permease [Clostridiales bacterium]
MRFKKTKNTIKDIQRHAFLNACLLATVVILSVMLFSVTVISVSLKKGMGNMRKRLGADIMLVPKGEREKAENMLLEGSRSNFYFDGAVYEKVQSIDGISDSTSQCFLKSLSADCCSSEVQIVFFDPESDFVVGPWIETEYKQKLSGDAVIVGSDIVSEDGKIKLFGQEYPIASQMARTGTALDSSVYFSTDAKAELLRNAEEKGSFLTEEQKKGDILSSIFINVDGSHTTEQVIDSAHKTIGDIFDVVYPKKLHESLSGSLGKITGVVNVISLSLGILLVAILLIINSIIMKGRKPEIALLRVLGHRKKDLVRKLLSEMGLISLAGALGGSLLGALIVIPFGRYIGKSLDMPYLGPGITSVLLQIFLIVGLVILIVFLSSVFFIIHTTNIEPYLALRKEE